MVRAMRPFFMIAVIGVALVSLSELARAEEEDMSRILILPLKGPGGAVARNNIRDRISDRATVKAVGAGAAQRPAKAARNFGADAMIAGSIRCPGKVCKVDVRIYRPSGKEWRKASETVPRAEATGKAADLAEEMLDGLQLLN